VDTFQRHRDTQDWVWKDEESNENYIRPPDRPGEGNDVVVLLSLSGTIHADETEEIVPASAPMYELTVQDPSRQYLRTREQRDAFKTAWQRLLADIRRDHGESAVIHLFPAIPAPIAVEVGRALLPKSDPDVRVYDNHKDQGGWRYALTV